MALAPVPTWVELTSVLVWLMPLPEAFLPMATWKLFNMLTNSTFSAPPFTTLIAVIFCSVESLEFCSAVLIVLIASSIERAFALVRLTAWEWLTPLPSTPVTVIAWVSEAKLIPENDSGAAVPFAPIW